MFTGIVEASGKIKNILQKNTILTLEIYSDNLDMNSVKIGDSVAVNGVCVTAVTVGVNYFTADISHETVACTTFKHMKIGTVVNLERAVLPVSRLGGHIVQGHVDCVGKIAAVNTKDGVSDIWVIVPKSVTRYIAVKGSVAVDGISLTVNEVDDCKFRLTIIPHTSDITNISRWNSGSDVNIEVDVIARYLERLITHGALNNSEDSSSSLNKTESDGITMQTLIENGYI